MPAPFTIARLGPADLPLKHGLLNMFGEVVGSEIAAELVVEGHPFI